MDMNTPEKLQDLCEDYLVRQGINTDNCLFLLTFAGRTGLELLFQESLDFCLDHFVQLTDSDEFVHLNKRLLIQLLQNDRLNVPGEIFVLAAISKLSVANQVDQQVVPAVRFSLIKEEELERFNNKHLVELARNIKQSSDRIKENPRAPDRRERLLALTHSGDLIRYDPITYAWAQLGKFPYVKHGIPLSCVSLATLGDSLYLLCGEKIMRFDLKHHTWYEDVAPMKFPRVGVSAVVLNGNLYALGGFDGFSNKRTVERYDACSNTWHLCAPMQEPRWNPAAAVLDGRIYVTRDLWKTENASVECYRPHTNTWSHVSDPVSLGYKPWPLSLVSFKGCLYLLDQDGQIFKYQSESDRWEKLTEGHLAPDSHLYVLNDKLYANCRNYFQILEREIGFAGIRWRWRGLFTPASSREIEFKLESTYPRDKTVVYYGLDCAELPATDIRELRKTN